MIIRVPAAILVAILLLAPLSAQAAVKDFDFTVNTHAVMSKDEILNVNQSVLVRNKTKNSLNELEIALLSDSVTDVTVRYKGGSKIPFSTLSKHNLQAGNRFEYKALLLDLPKEIKGARKTWTVEVSYQVTDGWNKLGSGGTAVMPNLDAGLGANWRLALTSPTNFPSINYAPKAEEYQKRDGRQSMTFSHSGRAEPVVAVSFLESLTNQVSFERQLRNRTLWPRTLTVILPPELHSQQVNISDISPSPDNTSVDRDGNVVASYHLWPMQTINVSYEATVATRQIRYDFSKAKPAKETPEELSSLITGNDIWTTQSQAGQHATGLVDPELSSWENASRILSFVEKEIELKDSVDRRPADEILSSHTGNTLERADLLVTMLRSQAIPARLILGHKYLTAGQGETDNMSPWVEAYIAGTGWTVLDPGWSQLFKSQGYSSADRIGLVAFSDAEVGGMRANDIIGTAANYSVVATEEELPTVEPEVELSNVRYMLFPYLGMDVVKMTSGSGRVLDGVALNGREVGSMAPGQELVSRQWFAGNTTPEKNVVEVGEENVAESVSEVRWWPAIVTGGLVIVLAMLQFYRLLRIKRYEARRLRSNPS